MSKDDDTKFTTSPVVFVLEEQIENLKKQVEELQEKNESLWQQNCEITGNFWDKVQENKKLRKDILMFQARYMELLPINKKLRECVEVMLEYSNCSWDKHPVRTEKESVEYVEKCLKDIDEDE